MRKLSEESPKQRPSIFLYTDAAEITDEVRSAMIEAGYLPVRVQSVDSVRILTAPLTYDEIALPLITRAALHALVQSRQSTTAHAAEFGVDLARLLLATSPRAPRQEGEDG